MAIDGKTSRRSHDRKRGQKALHLVSAFAIANQLVLGQEAVDEKSNETPPFRLFWSASTSKVHWFRSTLRNAMRTSPRAFLMLAPTTSWRSRTTSLFNIDGSDA